MKKVRDKIISLRINSDLYKKVETYLSTLNDCRDYGYCRIYWGHTPDGWSHGKYTFADFIEYLLINHLPKDKSDTN